MMTPFHQLARRSPSGRRGVARCAPLLLLAACGLPTEIPQVDQRWITPPNTTTIAVANLLPAGVGILADSSAFTVAVAGVAVSRALSADCAACATANGTTVPKPAFVATASLSTALPTDIATAQLTGTLQLSVQNNYNFDPLRPSATAFGYAIVTVKNGATQIGRDSVNGATTPLAPGATLVRSVPLSGSISSASPVTVTVQLTSPAGDPILMDANRTIVVTATPANLRVPTAAVTVANRQVTSSREIDLSDIDETITAHLTGGQILFDVVNPFNVTGTITVQLGGPAMSTITRSIVLAPGTTHPSITLDAQELRSMFGRVVTITFSGPVSSTGGAVTVSPKQAVVVSSRLDVTLHTGAIAP